ncbi:MAG: EAL domain-containing protein [Pseudolabrys sp.]|nr:EAL domain-containing protein [Pseudolabrys sp.]
MRGISRKDLIAMGIGVVLAGAPLVAFDFWLSGIVDRQGQEDVNTAARRAITLAENRVGSVLRSLEDLARRGVTSCQPAHIEAMRLAAFTTTPAKEFSIVGPDGTTLCTHLGIPLGFRRVMASEPIAGLEGAILDIAQIGEDRMVRLRRETANGAIAALIPDELFLPQVSTQGGPISARTAMFTRNGSLIAANGAPQSEQQKPFITGRLASDKFGFHFEMSVPRSRIAANHPDLEWLSMIATSGIALVLIGFALLFPRRGGNNPIAELERALADGQFVPYYQPIVDIRSGQLRGAEVLVRWRKPDGTLVLPQSFIPLAESSGLIFELTKSLMKRVCAEAGTAIGRRPALKISFNFAAQLFRDDSIVKEVRNLFAGSSIDMSQVVLELTERDPIENLTETRRVIAALQGLGIRIAIDDVGTGHSGLSYMLKLGVDIIKIDKMFVDAIGTDRNSTTIVETLIDLAHNMRMDVVAEGVENFEQVVHLRELGIRSAQGYVFAPPLPGSAFLQLMESLDPLPAESVEGKVAGAARRYMSARNRFNAA